MRQTLNFLGQVAILWGVSRASIWLVDVTGCPLPGNVVGVVILFLLLCAGVVKESHIRDAADFLLRHLVFFFIPIAVELMNWGGVFYDYGLVLAAAIGLSSALPLLFVGYFTQILHGKGIECSTSTPPSP